MMSSARDAPEKNDFSLLPGTFGCYLVTDETDELFRRAQEAGAEAIREPYDTDFGSRQAVVRDFEGNQWSFGSYHGADAS